MKHHPITKQVSPEFARSRIANSRNQLAFVLAATYPLEDKVRHTTYWLMANLEAWDSLEADGIFKPDEPIIWAGEPTSQRWASFFANAEELHGH